MKPNRPLLLATTACLLALGLGACSSEAPEPTPVENIASDEDVAPVAEAAPTPVALPTEAAPTPPDVNASVEMDVEPVTPPDEQMLDDASATGMTARATRDEATDAPVTGDNEQK